MEVKPPGESERKGKFSELSGNGCIVNAYEAVKLASVMEKAKK